MRFCRAALLLPAALVLLVPVNRWPPRSRAQRILRVSRVVFDLDRAQNFYRDALGFSVVSRGRADPQTLAALGVGDAEECVLRLGEQHIALLQFAAPGRRTPRDSRSDDLWFQHLAIVVSDMDAAYAHLSTRAGWFPISQGGPQLLPPADGSVRAFKFRDPDGHPLELIWFPPGQGRAVWHQTVPSGVFLGIDHSALAVASTPRSLRFYRALGLSVSDRSLNRGPAQARLDAVAGVRVRVTGLRPASATGPGLELLCYRRPGRPAARIQPNDEVTDWVTLAVASPPGVPLALRDPDGHRLVLVHQGAGGTGLPASGPTT
jgi:catechol 2,3-dioxygenase-like lactoylglutathione lyase family enzyme